MAETDIAWTHYTRSLAWGCIEATAGCDNCYARQYARRWGYDTWGKNAPRRTFGDAYWAEPLKWNERRRNGDPRFRIFCSSMTDNWLNDPVIDREREKLWPIIRATPYLVWQLLTKHPERFATTLPANFESAYPNTLLGVTIENRDVFWRLPLLRKTPGRHFLSCEPLLEDLGDIDLSGIDWVIVGGESGHKARPMELNWARNLRERCRESNVPFFLKQLGGARDARSHEKAILDGRLYTEFPVAA